LLQAAASGHPNAEELLPLVYDELRRMAGALMSRETRGSGALTLQPTALVHEAFMRLVRADVAWNDKAHFFRTAARAMRRILIDHARSIQSKRASRQHYIESSGMLPTMDTSIPPEEAAEELLGLDEAMEKLRQRDERQHDIVMLRFFSGLTIEQTALALDLSETTVKKEWTYARAWLIREVKRQREGKASAIIQPRPDEAAT
jgi:RNA polymerase sigma factor (TIGR02999 family)